MRRREFIALLGSAAVAWPLATQAQQPRRIAVLSPVGTSSTPYFDAFRARLGELGYVEGRDILLDFQLAGGQVGRLPALAEDLLRGPGINVIVAESTPAAAAARKATTTIPIVALVASDPVGSGLAASLAHPGGNVTGVAVLAEEMNAKRVELLRDAFPQARRFAAITAGAGAAPSSPGNLRSVQEAGRELGVTIEIVRADDPGKIDQAFSPAALAGFDGLIVVPDVVLFTRRAEVAPLLGASHRPVVYPSRAWVEAGGLMSLGPDMVGAYRILASQLDRVLKGTRPSDLPFERPVKLELVVNLKTARALGIAIPDSLLARADEVIE